jgi:CHAT domain-containing protein
MKYAALLLAALALGATGCQTPVASIDTKALEAKATALDQRAGDVDDPAAEQRRFREAGELRKQILDYDRATAGGDSALAADAMDHLAWDYLNDANLSMGMLHQSDRGRTLFAEARALLQHALAIDERAYAADDEHIASVSFHLAMATGAGAEHQRLAERAIAIYEKREGASAPAIADILAITVADYDVRVPRYREIEATWKRVVSIRETAFGADDRRVADALNRLGYFYFTYAERYDLAEDVNQRALAIYEKTLDPNAPKIAVQLLAIAESYQAQHRLGEAEGLYRRAAAIYAAARGPDDLYVAITLNLLAQVYRDEERYDLAKETFRQALAIMKKVYPANDSNPIYYESQIADTDRLAGNLADADAVRGRLSAFARDHGRDPDDVGLTELDLAEKRFAVVEKVARRQIASLDTQAHPFDPGGMAVYDQLARALDGQGRLAEALAASRNAVAIATARAVRDAGQRSVGAINERRSRRGIVVRYVDLAERAARQDGAERQGLADETFHAAQLAEASSTEQALSAMAVRFSTADAALAKLIRDRDDAQLERERAEASLTNVLGAAASGRDPARETAVRNDLAAADARLSEIDGALARDFPRYAEIANPLPLAIAEAQKLLGPKEALISYFVSDAASFLWVVRPDAAALIRLPIGRSDLLDSVALLRSGLDPSGRVIRSPRDIPRFDIAASFALYEKVFGPAVPFLAGSDSIFVVPDGALQSLPFGVLVTERPAGAANGVSDYRSVPWLARRYAMTVLPAVSSLRALRGLADSGRPSVPFAGFGDPRLDGAAGTGRGVAAAKIMRGPTVDLTELRHLPPLPDTADELRQEARALNAPASAIYLGENATVSKVKHADLADTRVIAFATHGLVAGDLPLLAEPALVLTPPSVVTREDSGLLKASDVMSLKLDADWVVLSACNTAAPDGSEGAEGLSGLAKAFFYAGARAVLVSHWPVSSQAAVTLTTGAFAALGSDPTIGRAEALRRSEMAMLDNRHLPDTFAHPMFWAPFVLAGEGGAGR